MAEESCRAENIYTILDDMSRCGVRRRHLMRSGEEWTRNEVGMMVEALQANEPMPMMCLAAPWVDEVGNYHLFLAWRVRMETMVVWTVEKGDFRGALVAAARSYLRRFKELPNRAIVNEELEAPGMVELKVNDQDPGTVLVVERAKWMHKGDLGVFIKADGDNQAGVAGGPPDGKDCDVEV